ncbi:MAG TPA: prolipoprotein diacylglyceryl transferase [Candidatus Acidoferrum sp.]|jgi:phosphatidylglycerol:prolipoprotein diacylglycerol transferase
MIPYLHIGPFLLPTFGLMVATGLFCASYMLQADFRRRGIHSDAFLIIGIAGLAGIVGARLYHVLETPSEFLAHPWPFLYTRFGFAWFGGFLGGFAALLTLSRREKIPALTFLDACSPAAAAGYAIGRIGCLLSGDGDYGIPTKLPWGMSFPDGVVPTTETCVQQGWPANCRVHPTPLYEFFIWMLIAYVLWRIGAYVLQHKKSAGLVFCAYLVLTGIARFLVEIIRLNPHSFLGMSNAQAASVASVLIGIALLYFVRKGNSSSAPSAVKPTRT